MYRNLRSCIDDLLKTKQMIRISKSVDTYLEMAAIQRQTFESGGPALLFENVFNKGKPCVFPMASNLYGSVERIEYIFRDTIEDAKRAIEWGADFPGEAQKLSQRFQFSNFYSLLKNAWNSRPKRVKAGPVFQNTTTLDALPQLVSWPKDGGPYVTLPIVYSESPITHVSNLGMYRVQIAGNRYKPNEEAGLHYQIQRGIAAHHAEAIELKQPLRVNVFVGGSPAMTLAAVMPFPEGVSELMIAGILGGHRIPMCGNVYTEADFCISGFLELDRTLPEGPFGDHLGYYSLEHEFPVFRVEKVWHRNGAIWPFTVVGRPPQEDSMFGHFIHKLTGGAIPKKLPGIEAVHAVDEAGVHPLLLAIGSERYMPFAECLEKRNRAAELHTLAHSLLGFGQISLAKYLFIAAKEDDPHLDVKNVSHFLQHILKRVDWRTDLHFLTETTIDTLDYSAKHESRELCSRPPFYGSKLIVAVSGDEKRRLGTSQPSELPSDWHPQLALPGVLAVEQIDTSIQLPQRVSEAFPLFVLVDDSKAATATLRDFLWTTFTKSDPASDISGFDAFYENKHWGCNGPIVINAKKKPHHAPEL